jgi:ubiquinol-cytochrome c reductase cytochrome b/c1 subunit
MSFWGATVITNFFSAIPIVGETVVTWLWGGYAVGNPTLQRFFSLHYLLPFVIAGVVVLHIWALHVVGQGNPTGVEPKSDQDSVAFTPYATVKDGFMMTVFCVMFAWFVFYIPNYLGHADNYIPANPGVTPAHIVPEWYYLPFYAILRSIPNKLLGVIAMFSSIVVLAFLPWLDTSKVRSANYRPLYRIFFWIFVAVCLVLGWLGAKPAEGIYTRVAQILTFYYFFHFIVILPLLGLIETPKKLPNSISESVLKGAPTVIVALVVGAMAWLVPSSASAQEGHEAPKPPRNTWSFAGPFGKFDQGQLQRGFKVYKEVCQTCHGLALLSFRNLADPGGPGFSVAQAEAIAADYKVQDGPNDAGDMFERNARLGDRFPPPTTWKNEAQARSLYNGAVPPDMSVLAKARGYERGFPLFIFDIFTQFQEHGVDYIVALMKGYKDNPPAGFTLPPGTVYNEYFPAHSISMPPPLSDGRVEYTDGTPNTLDQQAKDIAAFMMWAAEPHLDTRKRVGFQVMIFLLIFAGLMYFTKKKVWADVHGH